MSLIDNDERLALIEALDRFVSEESPLASVRGVAFSDLPYDEGVWHQLSAQIGLAGLLIQEDLGGAEASVANLVAVARELGAGLVPSPLLASGVMAATLLTALGDVSQNAEWLPRIASGEVVMSVAVTEPDTGEWLPAAPATRAVRLGDEWRLAGVKSAVVNGADADALLVLASSETGVGAFLVRAGSEGITAEVVPGLDSTRSFATIEFADTPAIRVSGDVENALLELEGIVSIFIAAEAVGGLRSSLQMTVDYAKVRHSFGLPIGAYQGVKHKLADMYADWSLADAAVRAAAEAWDDRREDRAQLAVAARLTASPVYVKGARNAMLLHGGIGFTWEHDAHLFYKNAISDNVLFGGQAHQRRRLASLLD